tara:strand:- start:642 stop:863 length:222 start_codon:yes stop_codon:yes gene_type:complete
MISFSVEFEEMQYNIIKDITHQLKHCQMKLQVLKILKELGSLDEMIKTIPELKSTIEKLILVNCKNRMDELKK